MTGTTAARVAVQCVHQHDAPLACPYSQALVAQQNAGLRVLDMPFFNACLERARAAVAEALPKARPVTHVAHGEGKVKQVASNRRVAIGPDGKVRNWYLACHILPWIQKMLQSALNRNVNREKKSSYCRIASATRLMTSVFAAHGHTYDRLTRGCETQDAVNDAQAETRDMVLCASLNKCIIQRHEAIVASSVPLLHSQAMAYRHSPLEDLFV